MHQFYALLAACAAATCAADHWAVLVAGSSGFDNYRHQADVAHAYHVLLADGVPAENIIVMMADDVANDPANPFPGMLFNRPSNNGTDFYAELKIDYRGKDVTPENFVKILTGNSSQEDGKPAKRVLQSTTASDVFVNFVDHGGTNLIGFPETTMSAKMLIGALKKSHANGLFKQMVFYLEACESGSMFQTLPAKLPIYAVTAANADESSWGCYCPTGDPGSNVDVVDGKHIGSCLGDLFSVNWMQDTEQTLGPFGPNKPIPHPHPKPLETFLQQYKTVKIATNKSHVMQFGQANKFDTEKIEQFEGDQAPLGHRSGGVTISNKDKAASYVDSRDIALHLATARFKRSGSAKDAAALADEVSKRSVVDNLQKNVIVNVAGEEFLKTFLNGKLVDTATFIDCHEHVNAAFGASCGWGEGNMKLSKTFYQLCQHLGGNPASIVTAVISLC